MTEPPRDSSAPQVSEDAGTPLLNIPNILSGIRFIGSFGIAAIALLGGGTILFPLTFGLIMTDWVDGKLAIAWKQRTTFGARLDSLADVTFYSSVLFTIWWLKSDLLVAEGFWIIPALAAYAVSCLLGLIKFRVIPTYHTRGAKTGWLLAGLAIPLVLGLNLAWPLRVVGIWILAVNIEAILITFVLRRSAVDIPSIYHAIKLRKQQWAEDNSSQSS